MSLHPTGHEVGTYSFLTVTQRGGKLYVNGINHLTG